MITYYNFLHKYLFFIHFKSVILLQYINANILLLSIKGSFHKKSTSTVMIFFNTKTEQSIQIIINK